MLENIRVAFRGIRTHKMRSFLTMLGVIIGIASIIAITSIVEGTSQQLQSNLVGSGNNVMMIKLSQDGYQYDLASSDNPSGVPQVSDDAIAQIEALADVEAVSRYTVRESYNQAYYGNTGAGYGYVYGVDSAYFDTLQYTLTEGRFFTEEEMQDFTKVCVIDEYTKSVFFTDGKAVGKVIDVKGEPYTVVGVVSTGGKSYDDYDSANEYYIYSSGSYSAVYVPDTTWPIIFRFDEPQNVAIRVDDAEQMASVGKDAESILNAALTSSTVSYSYLDASSDSDTLNTITTYIQIMLVGIASLSLLVGGIGVMNIMLVSVTERTAEIGLKKALGAKRKAIMAQFLTESAVITGVGGVIGVITGIALAKGITAVANMAFTISVVWVIISLVFSILIGLIFGAMPASKAAKLSPIEALRRD